MNLVIDIARLKAVIAPPVEALGFELVHLEWVGSERRLRVYVDSQTGVGIDDCAVISRQLGAVLDAQDGALDGYQLEVSSPGLDRPLVTPEHYQRFVGSQANIELRVARDGRRRYKGELMAADDENVILKVDEQRYELQYEEIDAARLVPEF